MSNPVPGEVEPEALATLAAEPVLAEPAAYLPAGVPWAHVLALRHAGETISFSDFAAACGWAFSFGYGYDSLSTAFMAVCGVPGRDGPYDVFSWLTRRLGYDYDGVAVRDEESFWAFVKQNVNAGTPILTDHFDGGIIRGYRLRDGEREVYFDGPVGAGWLKPDDLQGPCWAYVLRRAGGATPPAHLAREALRHALAKATAGPYDGVLQGLAALDAYRADVADPTKPFDDTGEHGCWFCWATFERLDARRCCADWLHTVADLIGGDAREPILSAADHYSFASDAYDRYRFATGAGEPTEGLRDRARTPDRIAVILPILDEGIAEERAGVEDLKLAVAAL